MFLSGPRTYEPVADEAAPDHEDDLSGLKKIILSKLHIEEV